MDRERLEEQKHLDECLAIIRKNLDVYEQKERAYKKEVTVLTQNVKKGDGDSYGALIAGMHILEHTRNSIRKSRAALKKAYFGRIDYRDIEECSDMSLYIGKNGVTTEQTDVVIVDWRAPAASVYYENELGKGTFSVLGQTEVPIDLKKKRTYDIAEEKLLGFYDDDAAANDELLIKYLSQNKEAALGDIIATIQKEQNQIIRDVPTKNIIVQGVAGSGKTTVALHRISYLLYNYEDRYKPSEFCIVGSSDMLLNYISSGLPELDVNHVKQMRMDVFLPYLMYKGWKKKYKIVRDRDDAGIKSKLKFVKALEQFLSRWRSENISLEEIYDDKIGRILSAENLEETYRSSGRLSLFQLEKLYNSRISSKIKFLCSDMEPDDRRAVLGKYRNYYHSDKKRWTEIQIYNEFLLELESQNSDYDFTGTRNGIWKNELDIYDTAAIALIWRRIFMKKEEDEFSQIIIDEAQDFGEMIYYVLKQLLPECYFTIMGDVSQNIHYDTGMNHWDGLKEAVFEKETDSFYMLLKSYRNTIEISECAGKVLEKASQGEYKIEPVIRRGREVCVKKVESGKLHGQLEMTLQGLLKAEYETIAVICKTEEEAGKVKQLLGIEQEDTFHNGVMVLSVAGTKGLEFDAVVLWKPDSDTYGNNPKDAKLLYVAITRALHELHILSDKEISGLFR